MFIFVTFCTSIVYVYLVPDIGTYCIYKGDVIKENILYGLVGHAEGISISEVIYREKIGEKKKNKVI